MSSCRELFCVIRIINIIKHINIITQKNRLFIYFSLLYENNSDIANCFGVPMRGYFMSFNKAVERKAKLELEIEQMQKQIQIVKNQVSNEKRKMQARTKIMIGAEVLRISQTNDEVKMFAKALADKFSKTNPIIYKFMLKEFPHLQLDKVPPEEEKVLKIEAPKPKKNGSLKKSTS